MSVASSINPSNSKYLYPFVASAVQIDTVVGDKMPELEDIKQLRFTTRVINEAMRLYPQPPVLIRRAIEDDVLGGFHVAAGSDIFISVWNIHRCQVDLYWALISAARRSSLSCHAGSLGCPFLP